MFEAFLFDNLHIAVSSLDGEIGRHSGLKIRRFVHSGRTGSIPVRGTILYIIIIAILNRFAQGLQRRKHASVLDSIVITATVFT